LDDPTFNYVPPGYDYYTLKPGEQKTFTYNIKDILLVEPQSGALYAIGMASDIPFRYLNEPKGRAFSLRQSESNAKKQFVKNPLFKDVRLK
jgi:hypothetical protein